MDLSTRRVDQLDHRLAVNGKLQCLTHARIVKGCVAQVDMNAADTEAHRLADKQLVSHLLADGHIVVRAESREDGFLVHVPCAERRNARARVGYDDVAHAIEIRARLVIVALVALHLEGNAALVVLQDERPPRL